MAIVECPQRKRFGAKQLHLRGASFAAKRAFVSGRIDRRHLPYPVAGTRQAASSSFLAFLRRTSPET